MELLLGTLGRRLMGVLWDSHGQIKGAKGGPLRVCDAMHAETMGLLEVLKLAKRKGARVVLWKGTPWW